MKWRKGSWARPRPAHSALFRPSRRRTFPARATPTKVAAGPIKPPEDLPPFLFLASAPGFAICPTCASSSSKTTATRLRISPRRSAKPATSTDQANDGLTGYDLALEGAYDVAIVDRMLPKMDGLTLVGALRKQNNETPVLILSALGQVDDRVKGLRAGGDDYLSKPYAFSELLARVEALARRGPKGAPEETVLRVADLTLDRLSHKVTRRSEEITLQPREFRLLEYLMQNAGKVVTRTMLLEHVWDYHFDPQTNVIDVHVSRLRAKIDRDFDAPLLNTVRGAGYMIRDGAR